jgi:UDP-N-acetylmuramoyl-L-alanyl-D-glutamate--2,6-diaminopimelate ligase
MARVADELADTMIVTSDNPRSEDPQAIVDDILSGLDDAARAGCAVRIDRREAIGLAIEQAEPDDVVLIAGKGHETYQIIGTERMHFDDREIAAECIARREDFS